jgi:hypothetical protein
MFFRDESTEQVIPTKINKIYENLYQQHFLNNKQYVCLKQGKTIHAFWSWLFMKSIDDPYKILKGQIPEQDEVTKMLWIAPVCISKKYRGKINWIHSFNELLPKYDVLASERNGVLRIINKKDKKLELINTKEIL